MTSSNPNPRSKVIFVNRYFFPDESATSQMLSDLAFGLIRNGFAVHVVCSRQLYGEPRADLPSFEHVHGVSVHRAWTTQFGRNSLAGRAMDYMTFYITSAWILLKIMGRGDTVVAKTDPPLISIVAMATARVKGGHLINWLQDIFPEVASRLNSNPLPAFMDHWVRKLRDATLRSADMNIVLGERMREFLERSGVPPAQICVIENWAGAALEPLPTTKSALRMRLGLMTKFVVGYSGNLGRAHDYDTVLAAADLLSGERDITFLVVGAGAGASGLKRAVSRLKLSNFQFSPFLPRASLADGLAAVDVHWVSLLPVLEGLIVPSKIYGILAAGRPLIFIGDLNGEVARVVRSAAAGVAIAVGDGPALARQILELKNDGGRRASMGRNGYRLYRDAYTPHRALARWSNILRPNARSLEITGSNLNTPA